ncbi:MAG: MBL fold metallo-hydrolase [Rhodospirillales bacterium 69-11]|nr:MBL fold metallo-hydrolase [Rhodospirillales bacterium]OJW24209.1 MAG: MBL fold metallo-hydrolase [Rhodospirillales bacterium 69-11]
MAQQVEVDDSAVAGVVIPEESTHELLSDVAYRRLALVNIVFVGQRLTGARNWVLVDAGLRGTAGVIGRVAATRFGDEGPPAAILLTHGHFDHVGALHTLAERWDVPIYAHPLEHPYLTGQDSYPPPDPSVGGGIMASMASLYPRGPVDVNRWLRPLPADGSVPQLDGWRWIHTPGHAPGHVSFWREADRTLLAGDAFVTTAQESAYAVMTQAPELHGPPMYYTPDWIAARQSVRTLAALEPEMVVTGHGPAMHGPAMREALHRLADGFDEIAVPKHGHYVPHDDAG